MELAIHIDRNAGRSIQQQLVDHVRDAILDGRLASGTRLPSTRGISEQYGISRNVVLAAYGDLYAEGYIEGHHGSGTFVVEDLPIQPHPTAPPSPSMSRWLRKPSPEAPVDLAPTDKDQITIDFQLGRPSMEPLPERLWRQLWRQMATQLPPEAYGPPEGYPELRAAIAGYLGRSRGIACHADQVMITSGSLQAIDLLGRALLQPNDLIGYEDPGYPRSLVNLRLNGARIAPIPVTDDGLDPSALDQLPEPPLLVYTTPSHQYPTGARMPVSARLALLDWAGNADALIIEDDYDSEFRFDGPPLPALTGLDHEGRTVYVGTFSKMLSPSLRIGYVVGPAALIERLVEYKRLTDFQTSWPVQVVLTSFIESGRLERHIRRMRRHYAAKRQLLGAILGNLEDRARLRGLEAGLHAFLEIMPPLDASKIARQAWQRGIHVSTIDEYFIGPPDRQGLLLGYGGVAPGKIERGAQIIAELIRDS